MITNSSSRLEKNTKYLFFCLRQIIYGVFLKLISHFLIFSKKRAAHIKIIVCVLFCVNMFDQTQYSLISPFSNDKLFKTGVHFQF